MAESEKCCMRCLKNWRITVINDCDHKGGEYYWCGKCQGAVKVILRNNKTSKLLVTVCQGAPYDTIAGRITELLPEAVIGPNGSPRILEVRSQWSGHNAEAMIMEIDGIEKVNVPIPFQMNG